MTGPVVPAGGEELRELADMLVRCGIERGVLGRIDADNVARILLPVVDRIARQRAAEELASLVAWARSERMGRLTVDALHRECKVRADALTGREGQADG